eukprot:9604194-Prorocentrum_lima.AAC.1
MTNTRNETLTTTDKARAFLTAPITKGKTILVAVPNILARLGMLETGSVKIRRAVHGLKESPRLWQEEISK